jgi:predicted ArsR family transcriptional regulator
MTDNKQRAAELLRANPMTRHELENKLGIRQQRVNEVLREIGAFVIGNEPRSTRGRPAPIYALEERSQPAMDFGGLQGVWR